MWTALALLVVVVPLGLWVLLWTLLHLGTHRDRPEPPIWITDEDRQWWRENIEYLKRKDRGEEL